MPNETFKELRGHLMGIKSEEEINIDVSEIPLSIEVTTHCNADCLHCFAHYGRQKRSNLSLDFVKEILSEGYDIGYSHYTAFKSSW